MRNEKLAMKNGKRILFTLITFILSLLILMACGNPFWPDRKGNVFDIEDIIPDDPADPTVITYTVAQVGGIDAHTATTAIAFVFDANIDSYNVTAADISIGAGNGSVTVGAFTGSGTSWQLEITAVNTPGYITITIYKDGIEKETKIVPLVYHQSIPAPTITGITVEPDTTITVPLNTTLNQLKNYLIVTAHYSDGFDYILSNGDYTLSGGPLTSGAHTITVNFEGYTEAITVRVLITYTVEQIGGIDADTDSVGLKFTFSADIDSYGLTAADIIILTGESSASVTMGALNRVSGTEWIWDITDVQYPGYLVLYIPNKDGIDDERHLVAIVYDNEIPAPTVTVDAVYAQRGVLYLDTPFDNLKNTLMVKLLYDGQSPQMLSRSEYSLSGTLTVPTSTITVHAQGFTSTFTVTIASRYTAVANGAANTTSTTNILLTFETNIDGVGLTANDIIVTNGTGTIITGAFEKVSPTVWKIPVTSVETAGNVTVSINKKFGALAVIEATAKTVAVHKGPDIASGNADIIAYYWLNQQTDALAVSDVSNLVLQVGSDNESLAITTTETFTDVKWYINGIQQTTADGNPTFTFSAVGREAATYRVQLLVNKNGKFYNVTFDVEVLPPVKSLAYELIAPANNAYRVIGMGTYDLAEEAGVLTIPDTYNGLPVTEIGSVGNATGVFQGNTTLTRVSIGQNVTTIGEYAFSGCTNIADVTFEGTTKVTVIGGQAFLNCQALTSVVIPNSVTSVDAGSFAFTTANITRTSVVIGSGVTTIAMAAFQNNNGLTAITIPENVTAIGQNAFANTTNLRNITINTDKVTQINTGNFATNNNWGNTFPATNLNVTFNANPSTYAFAYCTRLTSVTIGGNAIRSGTVAFYGCTNLTGVTLGANVEEISSESFRNCTGITAITIPANVTTIANVAFDGCAALTNVTFLPDPANVTIGSSTFPLGSGAGSDNLKTAYTNATTGGAGTYVRVTNGNTWYKQGSTTASVTISGNTNGASEILSLLNLGLDVNVIGTRTGDNSSTFSITIPANRTVTWNATIQANNSGYYFTVGGSGKFIMNGGQISNSNAYAVRLTGNVLFTINSGTISAGTNGVAIWMEGSSAKLAIRGGTISAPNAQNEIIYVSTSNTIYKSGGTVAASGIMSVSGTQPTAYWTGSGNNSAFRTGHFNLVNSTPSPTWW